MFNVLVYAYTIYYSFLLLEDILLVYNNMNERVIFNSIEKYVYKYIFS